MNAFFKEQKIRIMPLLSDTLITANDGIYLLKNASYGVLS